MNAMIKINFAKIILDKYKNGQRHFSNYDLENENFDDQNLEAIIFENCFIASSFKNTNLKNAKFINSNIKTSDFSYADLTNVYLEIFVIDGSIFIGAITTEIYFENNWFQGIKLTQLDFEIWGKAEENNLSI